jgi:amino acid transporter
VESASVSQPTGPEVGDKGLKKNAIGFVSSVVIGVASTAPGYSLAAVLGFVVLAVGVQAPAIMWLAFVPMLFIAAAYYFMNRADPDCGTTFTWMTKGMGPYWGWMGGWAIVAADILVMANLAQIAGLYTFLLFGWDSAADSTVAVTIVGVLWIVIMTAIVVIGIELSAKTQWYLLGAEYTILVVFAIVALIKVYSDNATPASQHVSASWFSPGAVNGGTSAIVAGVLLAVFIYWGWDSTVTVNEETTDSARTPGLAAITSTIILVAVYVLVATAAVAYAGTKALTSDANIDDVLSFLGTDVFGSPWDKLLIIAVLTSAAASTQTTILPTARTALSMARKQAIPERFGEVHPRFLTPAVASIWMGALSILWYVPIAFISNNVIFDTVTGLGLMISFYYGFTGFACAIYYRHELFKSVKDFVFIGVAPVIGGLMLSYLFIKSCVNYVEDPKGNSADGLTSWLGVSPPMVIGLGFLALGVVLMVYWRIRHKAFFAENHPETVDPAILAAAPASGSGKK